MPADKKDDPRDITRAHEWLAHVADTLDLPQEVQRSSVKAVLDLTKDVAHNQSRPAAPVTAFLVGLAAGLDAQGSQPADIQAAVDKYMGIIGQAAAGPAEDEV